MIDRNVRDGACETYWLETSASRGRVVPRAYAAGILALARRHGFRRRPISRRQVTVMPWGPVWFWETWAIHDTGARRVFSSGVCDTREAALDEARTHARFGDPVDHAVAVLVLRHPDGREVWLKRYEGNCY